MVVGQFWLVVTPSTVQPMGTCITQPAYPVFPAMLPAIVIVTTLPGDACTGTANSVSTTSQPDSSRGASSRKRTRRQVMVAPWEWRAGCDSSDRTARHYTGASAGDQAAAVAAPHYSTRSASARVNTRPNAFALGAHPPPCENAVWNASAGSTGTGSATM